MFTKSFSYILFIFLLSVSCSSSSQKTLDVSVKNIDSLVTVALFQERFPAIDTTCLVIVTHDQLQKRQEITVKTPKGCDSVNIEIPAGGTVTSACLFTDTTLTQPVSNSVSFMLGDVNNNYLTVSSNLNGRYFLSYGSCHWESRLWMRFE